jgi:hypothetical protein
VRPAEANCTVVETGNYFPGCARRESVLTQSGTDEAWVLVRRRENGRSRSDASRVTASGKPQGRSETGALAEEDTVIRADARGGNSEVRTVRESRVLSNHVSKRDEEASASWPIATRRKASRSLHCRAARLGRVVV